jgi:micrococcal nuclease
MMARVKILSSLVVLVLLIPFSVFAWSGKCVGVSDGDTISVMHEGKAEKIRLYGIDCPEMGQPFGMRAKQFTSDMVFGKTVEVNPVTQDRYMRTVAWVYVYSLILNKELIKAGLAWHYKQYSSDKDLALFEEDAGVRKLGLWADKNPVPPWEWRRGGRGTTAAEGQSPRSPLSETPAITPTVIPKQTESINYHGNTQSRIYHRPGCRYYDCKNCTTIFHSREEATNTGYRPCKICNP